MGVHELYLLKSISSPITVSQHLTSLLEEGWLWVFIFLVSLQIAG